MASAELAPRCSFRAVWRRVPSLRKRNDILRPQPDACYGVSLPDPAANAPTWSHSHSEMHRTPRPCRAYNDPVTAKDICLRRVTEKRPALQPTGRKQLERCVAEAAARIRDGSPEGEREGKGNQPASFTMLTTEPSTDVAPYHNRQVVVLRPGDWAACDSSNETRGPTLAAVASWFAQCETVRAGLDG